MREFLREHSLSLLLAALIAVMIALNLVTGYQEWLHIHEAAMPFWTWWASSQSRGLADELTGALILVLATKFFTERGSAEG